MNRPRPCRVPTTFALLCALACSCSAEELTVSGASPNTGSARGGTEIVISGKGFEDGMQVSFGNIPGHAVKLRSAEELVVQTPMTIAGTVDLTVRKPSGEGAVLASGFTFQPLQLSFVEAPSYYLPELDQLDITDGMAADFDNDGDSDLLIAVRDAPAQLLLNNGTGTFGATSSSSADAGTTPTTDAGTHTGDAGKDGSSSGAPSPSNGTKTLWSNDTRQLVAADIDVDGDLDVFLCNGSGQSSRVFVNDGHGTMTEAASALPSASDECSSAVVADLNKDGRPDIAIVGKGPAGSGDSYVRVFLAKPGASSLTFEPLAAIEPSNAEADGEKLGQTASSDSTGTATYVVSNSKAKDGKGSGKASFKVENETTTLTYTHAAGYIRVVPDSVELDLFGDDCTDAALALVIVDKEGERFSKNIGAVDWKGWKHVSASSPQSWDHADGNDDGKIDLPLQSIGYSLAPASSGEGSALVDNIRVAIENAGPVVIDDFERCSFSLAWKGTLSAIAAADLTDDGQVDLVVGNSSTEADGFVRLIAGDVTTAGLALSQRNVGALSALDAPVAAVALLDTDGDKDMDIITVSSTDQDHLLINDGAGAFFDDTLAAMPVDRAAGRSIAFADMDLDGKPDLLIANDDAVNRVYTSGRANGFVDSTTAMPLELSNSLRLVPLDVEHDGDQDLLVLNPKGKPTQLYVSVEPTATKP